VEWGTFIRVRKQPKEELTIPLRRIHPGIADFVSKKMTKMKKNVGTVTLRDQNLTPKT
jgi:hypothetical protein